MLESQISFHHGKVEKGEKNPGDKNVIASFQGVWGRGYISSQPTLVKQ